MNRRLPFVAALSIAALALAAIGVLRCSGGSKGRAKHLLFITVDTLRADRLGCYGGPNACSPVIDKLAKDGTLFVDAYVPRAETFPSMTTFFTSKYPSEHGITDNKMSLGPAEVLLAERLKDAGFHNRAWNASGVLAPRDGGINQGYEPGAYSLIVDEREMTEKATRFLRERFGKDGQREFVWLHYMNPHKPYDPPPPFGRTFDPDYRGLLDGSTKTLDRLYVEKPELADDEKKHLLALYDGQVAFVDGLIGQVLQALEDSGAADDTLVVFAADHGEELFSHNMYPYHSICPYRCGTRIPLIFKQKHVVRAGVRDEKALVESLDFVPTVLAWLGVDPDATRGKDSTPRGLDLSATLTDGAPVKRSFAFAQVDEDVFVARNHEWSLVSNPHEVMPKSPPDEGKYPIPKLALYHVAVDPDEQVNVLAQNDPESAGLMRALQGWLTSLRRISGEQTKDPAFLEELRQQGYVGGAPAGGGPPPK